MAYFGRHFLWGGMELSFKAIIKAIFPVFWGNWYVVNYILLYLIIPFINKMLEGISKSTYTCLVVIIIAIWCVVPTLTFNAWAFSSLDFFVVMYLIGGYIKRYIYGVIRYENKWNAIIGFGAALLLVFSVMVLDGIAVLLDSDLVLAHSTYLRSFNSIIALPCAIFVFLFFANIHFTNKYIDYIAKSVLGIYLLHDNELLRVVIWQRIWPNFDYVIEPCFHSVVKIILVFVVALLVDIVQRETCQKVFEKWFYSRCDAWKRKISETKVISCIHKYFIDG